MLREKQNRRLLVMCALLSVSTPCWAATYYVDATLGDDAHDGLSEANAWRTIAKVNVSSFLPGDSVLFKCGELWREQLVVSSSGTTGNPITFSQYGSNCTGVNKPIFSGADAVSVWSLHSGNIYVAQTNLYKPVVNLIENGGLTLDMNGWWYYPVNSSPPTYGVELTWISVGCDGSGGCLKVQGYTSGAAATKRFTLEPGIRYRFEFRARANGPTTFNAYFDRDASTNWGVATYSYQADVDWRSYSYEFTPNANLSQPEPVRVDFGVGAGQILYLDNVRLVALDPSYEDAKQLFVDGAYVKLAQHPNPRTGPTDTYLVVAADQANSVCPSIYRQPGTQQITVGDLAGAEGQDLIGAGIHIRTTDWLIDDRNVTAYNPVGKVLTLNAATAYNVCKGWGFYLDNKLWMIDSPGEWYYDGTTRQVYARMPDDGAPGARVEAGHREYGIDARYRAHIVIDGLRVEKAGAGVALNNSTNITLRNCIVADSGGHGINAANSSSAAISNCDVTNSLRNGIYATSAPGLTVTGNRINHAGDVGSPVQSNGGIHAGSDAGDVLIEGNYVLNTGYNGIYPWNNYVTVRGNFIEYACRVLNDCGGIYSDRGSVISGNVISHVVGDVRGTPDGRATISVGVYLDYGTSNVLVSGNTISDADLGIHMHDTFLNTLTQNTIYGARKWPVRIQEDTSASAGTIHDNAFSGNRLFSTNADVTYYLSSDFDTNNFGSYAANRYSSLYSSTLVSESYKPSGIFTKNLFTLSQWQQVRGEDVNSTSFDLFGVAPYRVTAVNSTNFIGNGNFNANVSGWSKWNQAGDAEPPAWEASCVTGGCLKFTAGTTTSILISNNFSIQKDKTYRVQADLRGVYAGQTTRLLVREGGSASYYDVGMSPTVTLDTAWETFSFVFRATKDDVISVPPNQNGARLDFEVSAGQMIYLDNVAIEEVTAEFNDPADDSTILINTGTTSAGMGCPDAVTSPEKCFQYVRFVDDAPVSWPLIVPTMGSEIVIWAENPMKDTDRDGIADSQDICAATLVGVTTDDRGCSFAQQHPADLTLSQLGVSTTGTSLLINDSVRNLGYAAADMFDISYYFSPDVSYQTGMDAFLCKRSVANLAGGDSNPPSGATQTICPIPNASAGAYYVIAIADSSNAITEGNETNNAAAAPVTISGKDLLPLAMSASRSGSNKVLVTETVKNQGNQSAGSFTIRYYLSTDTMYEPGTDIALASSSNGTGTCYRIRSSLGAGAASTKTDKTCYKPTGAANGVDYYVLVVDDSEKTVAEYNESNNVRATAGTIRW